MVKIEMNENLKKKWLLSFFCAHTDVSRIVNFEQLSDSAWEEIAQLSACYMIAPLLYKRLQLLSINSMVPASVIQKLKGLYLVNRANNVRLYHDFAQILKILQNQDITIILLKGAHLAEIVYGNIALRTMGDLDLLIRKADLPKAAEKLLQMGYSWSKPIECMPNIEISCNQSQHLLPLIKPNGTTIELHWTIENPNPAFRIDVNGLWERARPVSIAGVEAMVLSPEDLLLHLCLHTSYHHAFCFGLRPFCDISATIHHYQNEIDWKQIELRAHEWGVSTYVHITLWLTRELLGVTVPEALIKSLEPSDFDTHMVDLAKNQIFEVSDNPLQSIQLIRFWESKRILDKASRLLETIFCSRRSIRLVPK